MLTILGRKNSSNVQKVLWLCGELGVKFQREDYGGPFGKTKEPDYLAKNPNGLVPTIDDDGFVLWESNAILRYLATKHKAEKLYPSELKRRADVERWLDWSLGTLGPSITPMFLGLYRTPEPQRDLKAIEASRQRTSEAIKLLDGHLASRPYVAGDDFTIADIAQGMYVYRWFNFPIERPEYKNAFAYYQRLDQRPAFKEHIAVGIT